MNRISYLDGLRGVACLVVVLSHYLISFYPSTQTGEPLLVHSSLDLFLSSTPFNIFYNGDFAVSLFFVLSGFVLSYPYFISNNHDYLIQSAIRRFPRLYVPVFFIVLVSFFFLKYEIRYNEAVAQITFSKWLSLSYSFSVTTIFEAIKSSFYDVFFLGGSKYNVILWTMRYEFWGSMLVFVFLFMFGQIRNRWVFYLLFIIFFWNTFYVAFLVGVLICDMFRNEKFKNYMNKKVWVFTLGLVSILFGSFPFREVNGMIGNTFYSYLKFDFLHVEYTSFYHTLGAACLIILLLVLNKLQKLFTFKPILYFGEISFSIYLCHFIILNTFSCFIFLNLYKILSYHMAFLITFLLSFILIIVTSHFMTKFIDKGGIMFSKFFFNRFFKKLSR